MALSLIIIKKKNFKVSIIINLVYNKERAWLK